ncbi:gliding motility protein GldL [Fulvitalea axinellae]|uniref:Gliding motility protein GldL n=1 Tax=Fulvitalea axinellae TaxID=1182444 RepID=A0AAU9CRD9_9BACT|nr:gliding motility protein GldL [Fulvitalea axinellae]
MSKKKGGAVTFFYERIAPVATGLGAAVVILGALAKLQHWGIASLLLNVGMGAEAFLFVMFAFQPIHRDPDWSLVYPELDPESGSRPAPRKKNAGSSTSQKLDNMLEKNRIGDDLVQSLGNGIKNLATSVNKMSSVGDAFGATQAYSENVKRATASLSEMNKAYSGTVSSMTNAANASQKVIADMTHTTRDVMGRLAQASKSAADNLSSTSNDANEYQNQLRAVTKNLGALNTVYQMELKDSSGHLKAMNNFYGNMAKAMDNMSSAANESQHFQQEINKLTSNLASLNKVYGSMLTAMKG